MIEISPKAQKFSDDLMNLYLIAVEFEKAALMARNSGIELMDEQLPQNKTLMVMDFGAVGRQLMTMAATADWVKETHAMARDIGLKRGIAMPLALAVYSDEYKMLIKETVPVRLAVGIARR